MSPKYKQRAPRKEMPDDFTDETVETITRIEEHPTVVGVLYIKNSAVHLCSVPEATAQVLVKKLPTLNMNMHRALTEIAVVINTVNPIIDRIMEDDSVEGVIMTNKDGAPILTNISSTRATGAGFAFSRLGSMAQVYIKELDPFDEVLILRIITQKMEMMVAPHPEFNIIVAQHARHKIKSKSGREKINKMRNN